MEAARAATDTLATKTFTTDFVQCIKEIHKAHPFSEEQPNLIYTFGPEALNHLQSLHGEFTDQLLEAIKEGKPTPASKHIELIQRVAVALFVLDNTLRTIINNTQITFAKIIPILYIKRAAAYVTHWENQKDIIVKVINDITSSCVDVVKPQPTIRDIQAAILSIAGPVTTFRCFSKSFPRFKITTQEYQNATKDLTTYEMGAIVTIKVRHARPIDIYIKPEAANTTYNKVDELEIPIAPAFLETKLKQPSPPSITKNMKDELVSKDHIARDKFNE
ncbi:uncharacterized protein [Amphiura filiformis]|uniref:uncharacterized protein n=1 Tax=Amphiura filiformis TaxID=82378 RepID=UPI003B21783D